MYAVIYAIMNAILLALGGYLIMRSQLSVGQLVAAEIVVNAILGQLLYFKKYLESFYDMYAATHKLYPFYNVLDKIENPDVERRKRKRSTFDKYMSVSSIYNPTDIKWQIGRVLALSFVVIGMGLTIPWYQFSRATGNVIAQDPNDRVQMITTPVKGIVEEWLVRDGEKVKKGQPIVRVVDNDPNYLERLEMNRDALANKYKAALMASETAELNLKRQDKLVKEGLSSRKDFEYAKIAYNKLVSEASSSKVSLAKAETDLSRQKLQQITAPRDGQIRRILVGSGSTSVKAGTALAEFVPDSKSNIVELNVDGNDLPLIYPGRKVRLQFEGWPAVQFAGWPSIAVGSFGGIVTVVDPSVSMDGSFRILVQRDPEDENNWPDQNVLRQGTKVMGIVNLDEVKLGYELWRQINGFPKSTSSKPQIYDLKSKK